MHQKEKKGINGGVGCLLIHKMTFIRGHKIRNTGRTRFKKGINPWNKGLLGYLPVKNHNWMPKKENHYNWKGGISNNPYPPEFNAKLKLKIRTRDNFTCVLCGRTEREELEELNRVLCVNHIDFNKNNNKESNLNTLCLRCNVKINREREYWTNYFNNLNNE